MKYKHIFVLVLIILACRNGDKKEKVFEGYFFYGPEHLVFVESIEDSFSTWVNDDKVRKIVNVDMYKESIAVSKDSSKYLFRVIGVKCLGRMKGGGRFGHLGKYSQELTVSQILSYYNDGIPLP